MRILHIMGSADFGGIPSVVHNYMQFIDRDKYQFDIALNSSPRGLAVDMARMGASFYRLPLRSSGLKEYRKRLTELLESKRYDAIHVHGGDTCYVDLMVAKKQGIPIRIAHAHRTPTYQTAQALLRHNASIILHRCYATHMIACSYEAGNAVFGKLNMGSRKSFILPNAVDTERFCFHDQVRHAVRKELGLSDLYVIGMVAAFSPVKNHFFAFRVLESVIDQDPSTVLVLVGDGQTRRFCETYVHEHNLGDHVRFLGKRTDIERLYQAFDICILPSLSEGFPVVGVEAISSGIPILLSDHIPSGLSFADNAQYLPLQEELWVNAILKKPVNADRVRAGGKAREHGYDIRDAVHILENIYCNAGA